MKKGCLFIIFILMLVSCSDDPRVAPMKVLLYSPNGKISTLNKVEDEYVLHMNFAETVQLQITTTSTKEARIQWESEDNSIAVVNEDGFVTSIYKEGRVYINAISAFGTIKVQVIVS